MAIVKVRISDLEEARSEELPSLVVMADSEELGSKAVPVPMLTPDDFTGVGEGKTPAHGLVPQPAADKGDALLCGDGEWKSVNVITKQTIDDMDWSGGGSGPYGVTPELVNIMPTTGVKVVDDLGYIGGDFLGAYYPSNYNNFAILLKGADFSKLGLGQVTFVDSTATIGGRVYRTVTIGGKTWMAENLDFKFSGVAINPSGTPSGTPSTPAAWYYNRDEATYGIDGVRKCGLLYNWYAVSLMQSNRDELIKGWHVPSRDEWSALENAVGGSSVAATRLKASDGVSTDGTWPSGMNGTDDYGFSVLPAGYYGSESFGNVGSYGNFWTSTEDSSFYAYGRLFSSGASVYSDFSSKTYGFSVRLVKDS